MAASNQAASARAVDWAKLGKDREALVAEVLRVAEASPLITLSTVSPHGWPMTACMHFSIAGQQPRPLIYMFTNEGTRKLDNIEANPRIALAVFQWDERGGERLALHMNALCRLVTSPEEHAFAIAEHTKRAGYEHTQYLTLQFQPALRVDITRATLFGEGGPLTVDFPADA